jgi:hypothetical protein
MLRNMINSLSDTKFDDLIIQITSHQMLLSFWVNYKSELNFATIQECDWGCHKVQGRRHFQVC